MGLYVVVTGFSTVLLSFVVDFRSMGSPEFWGFFWFTIYSVMVFVAGIFVYHAISAGFRRWKARHAGALASLFYRIYRLRRPAKDLSETENQVTIDVSDATVACPHCGRENSVHTRICPRCETHLYE